MSLRVIGLSQRRNIWGLLWSTSVLFVCTGRALAAAPFSFQWESVEDSSAIYWPQRQQPAPESLLQVSLDEAQANVQALFPGETLSEFQLVAASEAGLLCAAVRLPSQVAYLVASRDGGKTWKSVWSKGPQEFSIRFPPFPHEVLSLAFDPRDPEVVLLGTTAGLYQNNQTNPRPPSALHVAVVVLHPENPDVLFMASRPFAVGIPLTLSGRGLYRRRLVDGKRAWDDLSPNLPGQVEEIGFDLQNPNRLYIRTAEGSIYSQSFPGQFRPEDFGWESTLSMPPKVKEEPPKTIAKRLLRVSAEYAGSFVRAPIEAHGGVLYGWTQGGKTGMIWWSLYRSLTGGFSWEGVGGSSGFDLQLSSLKVLYTGQNQVLVLGNGLPNIASDLITAWTSDPLDPVTMYVAQGGRGSLYRSQDMKTWEEISQGLDPTLLITEVAVDSSAAIYVRTVGGILRKQNPSRHFILKETRIWPDTLSAGSPLTITTRPVVQAGYQGGFNGTLSAEISDQRYPLADRGDGVYAAQIQLSREQPIGFDGATLFLDIPDQPLARVSQYLPFMVVSPEHVLIYGDEVAPNWNFQLVDGNMELAEANAFSGKTSLKMQGQMICQYSGVPIHPFGYVLEFYVAAEDTSAVSTLTINEQAVVGLASLRETKGAWTRIEIPAERLNNLPGVSQELVDGYHFAVPAYTTELRFHSPVAIYLDEILLRTLLPAAPSSTVVVETRDAGLPQAFRLDPNFPNPFNPNTTIQFALPASVKVELTLYNLAGQKVATLLSGPREAGIYALQWNGQDDQGRELASGVYFYRLQGGVRVEVRKLLLLR